MRDELRVTAPFLVPELKLWLLPPDAPSWHAVEPESLGMPYWAFAWPGGQVLARYVLDHPEVVRGKRVLDFASGCAVEGIAAAVAGAREVVCADIDPLCEALAMQNAQLNGVRVETTSDDLIGTLLEFDVVLAGDALYSAELAARVLPWLRASRALVLLGDPLRVPGVLDGVERLATYDASFDGDPRGLTTWPTHVLRLR